MGAVDSKALAHLVNCSARWRGKANRRTTHAHARRCLLVRDTLTLDQQVAPKHLSVKRFWARVVAM